MKQCSKLLAILGLVAFVSGINVFPVKAETDSDICTPTLKVQKEKKDSVTLKVTCSDMTKTKVTIKVQVQNNDDDNSTKTKTYKGTLGKNGNVSIKVKDLDSGTSYTFKAKLKKATKKTYSSFSESVDATTDGADYDVSLDSIKSITDDSVKLNITCEDLESEDVVVQVAYKKKTSWSKKEIDATLDGDGEDSITVDDLKSDTKYTFKVRIKKNGDSTYSAYSSTKEATTDEE